MTDAKAPAVYAAINAVQGELAKEGISKDGRNQQQGYNFRGIDQLYNALSPILAKHQLCILPRIISRDREERVTVKEYNGQRKESVLFYVTVEAEFDFIAAADGSKHTIRTYGEAMDSGDKATNKAMSAAYKYAAMMAFAIPTEGDNDADATTHEVEPRQSRQEAAKPISQPQWAKIVQLIEATGTNTDKMLKHYRVDDLKKMTDAMARNCINILEDTLASKAKKETAKTLADELGDDLGGFDQ